MAARTGAAAGYSYRREYAAQTYAARARIDVLEVVADHFFAMPLRGLRKLGVGLQRQLAVAGALLVDQAESRGVNRLDVVGFGCQFGVLTRGGEHARDRCTRG